MKKRLALILAVPLLFAACGNPSVNTTYSPQTASPTAAAPSTEVNPPNEAVKAPGVTLTLNSLTESDHLMLNAEGYAPGYLPEERQDPTEGGKFVTVNTTVENTSGESMDLTCGFGVQAHLFNDDGQKHDPINNLYRLPGNPECSDSLNPGFSTTMTWSFEVPEKMEATEFGFADPSTHYDDLTFIDVTIVESEPDSSETSRSEPPPAPTMPEEAYEESPAVEQAPALQENPFPGSSVPEPPVIGMTGAPGADTPAPMDKTIQECLSDPTMYQPGTTVFTDGTTGWTEQCANQ